VRRAWSGVLGMVVLGLVGAVAVLVVGGPVLGADESPAIDVSGKWTGICYGCQATGFTLVLIQQGSDVTGTVAALGRHAFGDSERPILNGKVKGRRLTFQAKGDPGDLWDVEVTMKRDGKTLEGIGDYRGSFSVAFKRASP